MEGILILCPQTVTVGSGQTVGFRSQQGEIYGKGTKCKVSFKVSSTALLYLKTLFLLQRDSSCPSLLVSCPTFDVPHAKENCRGPPDYLLLGNQRWVSDLRGESTFFVFLFFDRRLSEKAKCEFELRELL